VARLRAAGCVYAEDEAALLVAEAPTADALEAMVRRRVSGEPLEQVVGWAEFCGLRVAVEPGVFVPRRRTQLLVATAVARRPQVVVDLCCGTGAVALAVATELGRGVEVVAADVDPVAVRCARRNLDGVGTVVEGDLYAALPETLLGHVDVVVCNAPYVPTEAVALMPAEARDHEHRVALDGGADGVDVHRRVASGVRPWLAPGGSLVVETSEDQVPLTTAAFVAAGLAATVVRDESLDATAVVGVVAPDG
jgi:release factor glutamine methyltransferase